MSSSTARKHAGSGAARPSIPEPSFCGPSANPEVIGREHYHQLFILGVVVSVVIWIKRPLEDSCVR